MGLLKGEEKEKGKGNIFNVVVKKLSNIVNHLDV
jgi:hypothetical protein